MNNLVLKKEHILKCVPTQENSRFLEENSLVIKGHISYEIVLSEKIKELGERQAITLQGKPGGKLKDLSFAKVNYGLSKEGKDITPFGVVFFEEGEEE